MSHEHLAENVESDPKLNAAEKETGITILGDEKQARVSSAKKTIVKSLLQHDHFTAVGARGLIGDEHIQVSDPSDLDTIYYVTGTMPVGCLTVKSAPRANNNQSGVVNHEGVDPDAFSDS